MGNTETFSAEHPRYSSVIGLGFGDCGKGLFTDYLCRRFQAHTVVRFNGGAQAGHNVVLPDGTHHTFSQFGSGSFLPNVYTVLLHPVVIHPTALLYEYECLRNKGVSDAMERLIISSRCRVITPFHQSAGRIREIMRGSSAHGTCGTGFGEAVHHSSAHPDEFLTYGELSDSKITESKLEMIRQRFLLEFKDSAAFFAQPARDEFSLLQNPKIIEIWQEQIKPLLRMSPPASKDRTTGQIHRSGRVIFEGAQGVLLDEWRGFHPHTTWSSVHADALDAIADSLSLPEPIRHFGVIRTYMTRHGNGPLPTFDPALNSLTEHHNSNECWQGDFRRGHPDSVLLRYALKNSGKLSGLLISHMDIFDKGQNLKWCRAYRSNGNEITDIPDAKYQNLDHQTSLTKLLAEAQPVYDEQSLLSSDYYIKKISGVTKLPVLFTAYGNNRELIREQETLRHQ